MIYFFTIASPARSGTMWYSKLFTTENSYCYHELSQLVHPYPSNIAIKDWLVSQTTDHNFEQSQRRAFLQGYPDYFKRLWERNQYPEHKEYVVGNSDCGILSFMPALWLLWPDMRFVFSVRNGINCVHSHFMGFDKSPTSHIAALTHQWQTTDPFKIACRRWVASIDTWQHSKEWLAKRKAKMIETRFEIVAANLAEVRKLWDWIGIGQWEKYQERNRALLTTPINARTNQSGVVTLDEIWAGWLPPQRAMFNEICGSAMRQLGYKVPVV